MGELLAVGLGGFIGALLRYGLSATWIRMLGDSAWARLPIPTLIVNVLGSFALGLLMRRMESWELSVEWRLFLTVGILGALTTFSTFSFETMQLFRSGAQLQAVGYALTSLVLAFAAVSLGWALAAPAA